MKIINIVGARPNFMKIAPLMRAYQAHECLEPVLVHSGQHYDRAMSELFFEQLGIPRPDINLGVGSSSHAKQTAEIMTRFEQVCLDVRPDLVLVVGDVNSTIACALVAKKLGIRVAHVEAGLRSFDRAMPEEINRVLTDSISDILFVTEPSGLVNLENEGVPSARVHFVGNVMIDTLLSNLEAARRSRVLEGLDVEVGGYGALTLHRPSNVDDRATFEGLLNALEYAASKIPLVFPLHPRTRHRAQEYGLLNRLEEMKGMVLTEALGYLDFLHLMANARVVLTDSGGIQEETTILKVPCLTLRENTERPITCSVGGNRLVGTQPERVIEAFDAVMAGEGGAAQIPELWDGHAAERIAAILAAVNGTFF